MPVAGIEFAAAVVARDLVFLEQRDLFVRRGGWNGGKVLAINGVHVHAVRLDFRKGDRQQALTRAPFAVEFQFEIANKLFRFVNPEVGDLSNDLVVARNHRQSTRIAACCDTEVFRGGHRHDFRVAVAVQLGPVAARCP